MTGEEMRDQLAAAVAVAMDEAYDYSSYRWPQQGDCPRIADSLLPVVRKIASRQAGQVLRAAAQEQRNEAEQVPDTDEGTHADGHRCAADFLDRRAAALDPS